MPKTSCLPDGKRFLIVRDYQLTICGGNACAAFLISYLAYWHDIKTENSAQAAAANDAAAKHGDPRTQYEGLLQWHTSKALEDALLGMYSINTISKAIEHLVEIGVVEVRKNPNLRYAFDRTRHFLFKPEEVVRLKEKLQEPNEPRLLKVDESTSKIASRCPKSDSPSPKVGCSLESNNTPEEYIEDNTSASPEPAQPSASFEDLFPESKPHLDAKSKVRPRNLSFDALVSIGGQKMGEVTKSAASGIGRCLKEIKEVCPLPDDQLAAEIRLRASNWKVVFKNAILTAEGLTKHWGRLGDASMGAATGYNPIEPAELDLPKPSEIVPGFSIMRKAMESANLPTS